MMNWRFACISRIWFTLSLYALYSSPKCIWSYFELAETSVWCLVSVSTLDTSCSCFWVLALGWTLLQHPLTIAFTGLHFNFYPWRMALELCDNWIMLIAWYICCWSCRIHIHTHIHVLSSCFSTPAGRTCDAPAAFAFASAFALLRWPAFHGLLSAGWRTFRSCCTLHRRSLSSSPATATLIAWPASNWAPPLAIHRPSNRIDLSSDSGGNWTNRRLAKRLLHPLIRLRFRRLLRLRVQNDRKRILARNREKCRQKCRTCIRCILELPPSNCRRTSSVA